MSVNNVYRQQYGLSTNLTVRRESGVSSLILSGSDQGSRAWSHLLTQRAAQMLWIKLTALLYPDKSDMVTRLATTAPLSAPTNPSVTTHVEVAKSGASQYTLVGWVQRNTWKVLLSESDARQLWMALDVALFPVGWEGRHLRQKALR